MKTKRADLKLSTQVGKLNDAHAQALVVGVFAGGDIPESVLDAIEAISTVSIRSMIDSGEIGGEFKEYTLVHLGPGRPVERVIFMGLGRKSDYYLDKIRSVSARAARTLRKGRVTQMMVCLESFPGFPPEVVAQAVTEGTELGLFRQYKYSEREDKRVALDSLVFLVPDPDLEARVLQAAREGKTLAGAVNKCRNLANLPGNVLTPSYLAEHAEAIAQKHGMAFEAWGRKELEAKGMGGILAVSQGSKEEPRFITLRHNGAGDGAPVAAYVGKGITFDSGGISLKPAERMGHMKYDMAGAAAVLATMKAVAELEIPINLVGVIPTCENLPDGKAYKPGDVIKMYAPKHVEVVNTDAEGRMLLADALYWACEQDVDFVVDIATLTGGCVIALGTMVAGVMSNNDWLCRQIIESGITHEEKMWRLPLFPEYRIQIRTPVADIANSGGRPASASTAGLFLQEFVSKPWAHIDIAGTAWIEEDNSQYFHQPYLPKRGATGWGVRTLTVLAQEIVEAAEGRRENLSELLKL